MARYKNRTSPFGWLGWRRVGRGVDLVVALGLVLLMAIAGAVVMHRLGPARLAEGHGEAIDGDSLRLAGEELRLWGIDAPEYRQNCRDGQGRAVACGRQARAALAALLARGPLRCEIDGLDRYGRGLARCRAGETDLNATLVRDGQAVAYGGYLAEEAQARAAARGIWAYEFERPEAWRRARRP